MTCAPQIRGTDESATRHWFYSPEQGPAEWSQETLCGAFLAREADSNWRGTCAVCERLHTVNQEFDGICRHVQDFLGPNFVVTSLPNTEHMHDWPMTRHHPDRAATIEARRHYLFHGNEKSGVDPVSGIHYTYGTVTDRDEERSRLRDGELARIRSVLATVAVRVIWRRGAVNPTSVQFLYPKPERES